MAVSSCNKHEIIDGIRRQYNTSILCRRKHTLKGPGHHFPAGASPCLHHHLITEGLQKEHRKLYLQASVSNLLLLASEGLLQMVKFLRLRKEHKLQRFSQSHHKIFSTFTCLWEAYSTSSSYEYSTIFGKLLLPHPLLVIVGKPPCYSISHIFHTVFTIQLYGKQQPICRCNQQYQSGRKPAYQYQ